MTYVVASKWFGPATNGQIVYQHSLKIVQEHPYVKKVLGEKIVGRKDKEYQLTEYIIDDDDDDDDNETEAGVEESEEAEGGGRRRRLPGRIRRGIRLRYQIEGSNGLSAIVHVEMRQQDENKSKKNVLLMHYLIVEFRTGHYEYIIDQRFSFSLSVV